MWHAPPTRRRAPPCADPRTIRSASCRSPRSCTGWRSSAAAATASASRCPHRCRPAATAPRWSPRWPRCSTTTTRCAPGCCRRPPPRWRSGRAARSTRTASCTGSTSPASPTTRSARSSTPTRHAPWPRWTRRRARCSAPPGSTRARTPRARCCSPRTTSSSTGCPGGSCCRTWSRLSPPPEPVWSRCSSRSAPRCAPGPGGWPRRRCAPSAPPNSTTGGGRCPSRSRCSAAGRWTRTATSPPPCAASRSGCRPPPCSPRSRPPSTPASPRCCSPASRWPWPGGRAPAAGP